MPKVLVVDDTPEILSVNLSHLREQGYEADGAGCGEAAVALLRQNQYDCVVLDILMPDMDGYAVCQAARSLTGAPIIFLSCLDDARDKIRGLMTGGDDYMTKPYSLEELTARIHALLRRSVKSAAHPGAEFFVDRENRMIQTSGKIVLLSQKEYDLFMLFYKNPLTVFTKDDILEKVWKGKADLHTVSVNVARLRRKLGFAEKYIGVIGSEYGSGYRLIPPKAEDTV